MKEEEVILVDQQDNPIGLMPKMEAHEKALLTQGSFLYLLSTTKVKQCFNKEHFTNITLQDYGRTLAVVTNVMENPIFKQGKDD